LPSFFKNSFECDFGTRRCWSDVDYMSMDYGQQQLTFRSVQTIPADGNAGAGTASSAAY
jgi:hypothetical protein